MTPTRTALPRLDAEEAVELEGLLGDLARVPRTRYVVEGRVVDGQRTTITRQGERPWEAPSTSRALELLDQLTTNGTGQARLSAAKGKSSSLAHERPLPYAAAPLDALAQLAGLLTAWAQRTHALDRAEWELVAKAAAGAGAPPPPAPAAPHALDGAASAAYLLSRLPALVRRPGSSRPELDALRRLVLRARQLVDRPVDRWYAGPCSTPLRDADDGLVIVDGEQAYCTEELWARPATPVVVCRACKASHRVEKRRAELLRLARDRLDTATHISRALTSLGTPVTAERIRQWKRRGRLVPHGQEDATHPLYRVGDVMDLLVADAQREERRTQRQPKTGAA